MKMDVLTPALLHRTDACRRAANYLSVGRIHLHGNPLLRQPLKLSHVKPTLLGHGSLALGANGAALKRMMQDTLAPHKRYIDSHGHGMPEIREWNWVAAGD